MGKNMRRLLKFAIDYPGWHPFGTDRSTIDGINLLSFYGFCEIDHASRKYRLLPPMSERVKPE